MMGLFLGYLRHTAIVKVSSTKHQVGFDMYLHTPANHQFEVQINHNAQVKPAFMSLATQFSLQLIPASLRS
jgi:hypothetical protein